MTYVIADDEAHTSKSKIKFSIFSNFTLYAFSILTVFIYVSLFLVSAYYLVGHFLQFFIEMPFFPPVISGTTLMLAFAPAAVLGLGLWTVFTSREEIPPGVYADVLTSRNLTREVSVLANRVGASTPCLLYTSPSPRDQRGSRMPSSA